jgi:hypothetical protein
MLLSDSGKTDGERLKAIRHVAARIGRAPKSATAADAAALDAFLRDHLRNTACQTYADMLARGQDASALEAASVLLKFDDSALSKAALVTTALAHQPPQAREHQRAWAKEAASASATWKHLEEDIGRVLNARPTVPSAHGR